MKGQRTKGTHFLHVVKLLRANRERLVELLNPALLHYLDERILPSSWYSSDDHLELLRVVSKMMPKGIDPWIAMGRGSARMDLEGAYKHHFRFQDPEMTLRVLPAVWKSTHDTGKFINQFHGPYEASFKLVDYPVMTDEICRITTGYIIEALNLSGAKDPDVQHITCVAAKASCCTWIARWAGMQW